MGDSIQQWNAIRAANAAEEIQWQNRATHLRGQGILGPAAGAAEARAYDRQQRDANRGVAASILPGLAILAGGILFVWIAVAFFISTIS